MRRTRRHGRRFDGDKAQVARDEARVAYHQREAEVAAKDPVKRTPSPLQNGL